jgi:hypothetical protein
VVLPIPSDTNDVLLAAFDVKAENAAMKLQRVPVVITTTVTDGGSNTAVVKNVKLYANGTLLATESVMASNATTETVTFGATTRLNYAIASNATVKFEVKADLNDIENTWQTSACTAANTPYQGCTGVAAGTIGVGLNATDFDNGDKVKASVDSATMTVELDNAMGDTVSNRTGSLNGADMTLRSEGVQVTMGSATSTATR